VPQIGPLEVILVAVIALIVFGPEKLPELARKVGKTAAELRRIANEAKEEFRADIDLEEDEEPPRARRDGARSEEPHTAEPAPRSADRGEEET
jgi:sec-independent protein translocase protein TatB